MGVFPVLLFALASVCGIASLVCFIIVVIKMFQNDQTVLGIVCIVLALCTGLGVLVAFIFGWIKSSEWQLKNVMLVWSLVFVLNIVTWIMILPTMYAIGPANPGLPQQEFQIDLGQ